MRSTLTVLCLVGTLAGCRSTASEMNDLSVGMTKAEVRDVLGSPHSTAANEGAEFQRYVLHDSALGASMTRHYFVKLVDGRVVSYGMDGDFRGPPEQTINVNWRDR